ncbi:MAG TPA: 2Fe-2S iron-sulfur cluster-binding protein [Candidatus Binataceae bacterium]|nr:2Fe-2S iron-sulfur cluster-binding protein [Candidatus Binataceae bacterium]
MKSRKGKDPGKRALSRRSFLKGAALTSAGAVAAATLGHLDRAQAAEPALPEGVAEQLGPGPVAIDLKINGVSRHLAVEPRVTLLRALREDLGMTGAKLVCDRGACGACTVHLDGAPVTACMILAVDARGHEITTIEGLGEPGRMHPLQEAFVDTDAMQCGFCTPGMVMSLAAALKQNPAADLDAIRHSVAGNICRCGTYPHVFAAALRVARAAAKGNT